MMMMMMIDITMETHMLFTTTKDHNLLLSKMKALLCDSLGLTDWHCEHKLNRSPTALTYLCCLYDY